MAALSFAGAVALASSIALGGCFGIYLPTGENACEIASAQLRACLGVEPSESSMVGQCADENLCVASCINTASCDELRDAFGGTSSALSSSFTGCTAACFPGSTPPPSGER
jgi:hypothetical protein